MIIGRLVAQLDLQDAGFASGMARAEQSMQRANVQVNRTTTSITQMASASSAASLRHAAAIQRQTLAEQKLADARRSGTATQQQLMQLEARATAARASAISASSRATTAQRQLSEANRATAASTSQVITSTREQTTGMNGLAAAVVKARTVMATLGITAGAATSVRFFTDAIQNARLLGAQTNQLNIIFGSSMGTIQEWSKGAVQAMSMSQRAAQGAAIDFATFGAAADMSGKDLAKFSMSMTQLAADAASFYAVSPEKMIEDMTSAFAGQSRPMMKYGVLLQEATLQQAAFKHGITESARELSQTERIQAVYVAMMDQMAMTNGDVGRTSEAFGNKLKRLKAGFEETSAAIGQKIMPIAKAFVDLLAGPGLSALSGVGEGIGVVVNLLTTLASAWSSLPGPIQSALAAIVGFRLAQRLLGSQFAAMGQHVSTARGAFSNFGQQVTNVQRAASITGTTMGTTRATLVALGRGAQTASPMVASMSAAFLRARSSATSFGTASGVAAAGMAGLRGAASGLSGALGGPWGMAIMGATVLLGAWIAKKQKDKQASQEAAAQTLSWAEQISSAGGKITSALRTDVLKQADDDTKKLAVSNKTLAQTMTDLGFSNKDTVDTILKQGDAYDRVRGKLLAMQDDRENYDQDTRVSAYEARLELEKFAGQADDAKSKAQRLAEQNGDTAVSFDNSASSVGVMTEAMTEFEESTEGAASKVDKLSKALDQLEDDSLTQEEALQAWSDGMRDFSEAMGTAGESAITASGNIDVTTEAGSKLQDIVVEQREAFNDTAAAAYEYARAQGMDVAQALDYTRGKLVASREQFIEQAVAAGVSTDAANRLADAYGMIPDQVVTRLNAEGIPNAIAGLNSVGIKATTLPTGNLKIVDNTPEVRAKLDQMKVAYKIIDGKVVIDSNSPEVIEAMEKLGVKVEALPDGYVKLEDNSPAVMKRLDDLGIRTQTLPDGTIVINPEDKAFWEAVRKAQEPGTKVINLTYREVAEADTAYQTPFGPGGPSRAGPGVVPRSGEFFTGGYTGAGGKYEPAGVVHRDEFVVRKESRGAIEAAHPGALDYMNRTGRLPGYYDGGRVEVHQLANYMRGIEGGSYTWGGWNAGWNTDCSGGQSIAVEGAHGNMQPGTGERAATASFSTFLPSRGYRIGRAPAGVGAHEIGWSPEHAAGSFFGKSGATVNFEMGGGTDTYADGKYGGSVGSRASQFPNQAYIILPDTYGGGSGGGSPVKDVALTEASSRDDVASKIIAEGRQRGYSDDQVAAILSMAIQENQLRTDNVFQQMDSSVYPGRDDPNTNITGFYDALDAKKGSSGWSDDIWSNLFWLQQAPSAASAADAVANGRQAYLDEIKAHQDESKALVAKLGPAVGGTGSGDEFSGGYDGGNTDDDGRSGSSEPPEDPTLYTFTIRNPFEPFWWRGEKEQRQHVIDEHEKQQEWEEYIRGGDGKRKKVRVKSVEDAEEALRVAEEKLNLARMREGELGPKAKPSQRESARQSIDRAESKVEEAKEDLAEARANPSGYRYEEGDDVSRHVVARDGGPVRRMAAGGTIPGVGSSDSVHILGMPGEEMIRKDIAESPGMRAYLKAINRGEVKPPPRYGDGGTVGFGGYADDDRDAMRPKNWYDWLGMAKGAAFAAYNTFDPYVQMAMSGQIDLGNSTPTISGATTDTAYVSGVVNDLGGQISQQLQELIWAVKEGKDIRVVIESENKPQGFGEFDLAGMARGF